MITLPTSAKHTLLLDTAIRRALPGTQRAAFLQRIGRSLDRYGSLTPAMINAVSDMITVGSSAASRGRAGLLTGLSSC